jgi:hypothetical protein
MDKSWNWTHGDGAGTGLRGIYSTQHRAKIVDNTIRMNSAYDSNSGASAVAIYISSYAGLNYSPTHIKNNIIDMALDTTGAIQGIYGLGISTGSIEGNNIRVINTDHTIDSFGIHLAKGTKGTATNTVSFNSITMGNDANDIGINTASGCSNNYGVGNVTFNVGSNNINSKDDITIQDI